MFPCPFRLCIACLLDFFLIPAASLNVNIGIYRCIHLCPHARTSLDVPAVSYTLAYLLRGILERIYKVHVHESANVCKTKYKCLTDTKMSYCLPPPLLACAHMCAGSAETIVNSTWLRWMPGSRRLRWDIESNKLVSMDEKGLLCVHYFFMSAMCWRVAKVHLLRTLAQHYLIYYWQST